MDYDLIDIYLEFIESSIHQLLYSRSIYPQAIFETRLKYGVTIFQSRHPEINSYIKRFLCESKKLFSNNLVSSVLMITRDDLNDKIFDIIAFSCNFINQTLQPTESSLTLLEEEFRSSLLKIGLLDTQMEKKSEGCRWDLVIELIDSASDNPKTSGELTIFSTTLLISYLVISVYLLSITRCINIGSLVQ